MLRRICFLSLLLATAVHAETFVIAAGVETYDDQRIAALKYAVADAKSIAASFRASGVPRQNVTLLVSGDPQPERRPTRVALLTALDTVREKAHPGDRLVFFFAGHGIEEGGEQYLLTSDTRRSLLKATALPTSLINAALSGIRAHELLFLIDACRNNPNASRGDEGAQLTEGLIRGIQPEPRPDATEPPVVATLLSCDVGQRAYEEPTAGHGVFTVFLLKGLAGAASSEDGQVRLLSLAAYVQRAIEEWCAQTRRAQRPRLVNPDNRDMVLLRPPSEPLVSVSFRGTRLADATTQLAEDYGVQIVLGKGANPEVKVTGHLENQPLSVVLKVLLLAYDLTLRRQGTIYIIEEAGAAPEPVQPQPPAVEQPEGFDGPTITVAQDGSGQYKTILEAVRAAPDGATIRIGPGTYSDGPFTFSRRVALAGEGAPDQTVLQIRPGTWRAGYNLEADGCCFSNLTFDGGGQPVTGFCTSSAGGVIKDCRFIGWADQVVTVQATSRASLTLARCAITGTTHWAAQVGNQGTLFLEDCVLEGNVPPAGGAQVLANSGGRLAARRCRFVGGWGAVSVAALANVELDDCDLTDASACGLCVLADAGRVNVRNCRLVRNGRTAFELRPQDGYHRYDPVAAEWKYGAAAAQLTLPPANALVEVTGCDLRGNANGAFGGELAGRLTLSGNTYDPGDPTVPKDQTSAVPPAADFPGPTITVAQDGSGQYTSIQAAVDAAPEGAVIRIKPGTYQGVVEVHKRLALVGDPQSKPILEVPTEGIRLTSSGSLMSGLAVHWKPAATDTYEQAITASAPCRIENCDVVCEVAERPRGGGILCGGPGTVEVVGCTVFLPVGVGIGACKGAVVVTSQCVVSTVNGTGFSANGSELQISQGRVTGGRYGVMALPDGRILADRSEFTHCLYGVATSGGRLDLAQCEVSAEGDRQTLYCNGGSIVAQDCTIALASAARQAGFRLATAKSQGVVKLTRCRLLCEPGEVSVDTPDGKVEVVDCTFGDAPAETAGGLPFDGPQPAGWPDYLPWPIPGMTNPALRFRVCEKDGMPQVLIRAGEFLMGSPPTEKDRGSDEGPQKRVYVSAFWMDLHEVTVGQYKKFCQATGRQVDDEWRKSNTNDQHPVVVVSWVDATAYARWTGRELPTEAQWEKAARGGTTTAYPWGDRWDESKANNNQQGTTPVGSCAPNGFGLFDMIGNVWEWCRDWHDEGWYAKMPARDPVNGNKAIYSILRGGSWLLDPWTLRAANRLRSAPVERPFNTGFRCSAAP